MIQSIPFRDLRYKRISAQQLNRSASSVVDAALQAKKEDVTRLVGRDGIAGAWEIKSILWFPHIVIYEKITTLIAGTSCQNFDTKFINKMNGNG